MRLARCSASVLAVLANVVCLVGLRSGSRTLIVVGAQLCAVTARICIDEPEYYLWIEARDRMNACALLHR